MDSSLAILAGLVPLLLFVIVDSFAGLKWGLIVAAIAALGEAILSIVLFGHVDIFTLVSILLVLVLSLASWKMKSPLLFKLQPVVVGAFLSLALIVSSLIGQPLMLVMATKYQAQMPELLQQQLQHPVMQDILSTGTWTVGLMLIIQTALVAFAAYRLSNWWWIIFRGIGFYVFVFFGGLIARFIVFS